MSDPFRRTFVFLAWTAAAMAALLAFLPAAGHDQLWFLLMARRWIGGATLYGPEIFDANPPFIVWLSALPVLLAQSLHLPATLVAKTLVLFASLATALFCFRLLSAVWRPVRRGERPALLFAFIVLAFVLPARDLGQRDALAGVLVLPYVLAAARGRSPVSALQRLAATLLASGAFCLKPQDALIAVAVEVMLLVDALGSTRPESGRIKAVLNRWEILLLLGTGSLYLLAIRVFAPLYLTSALPVIRETYWAIGHLPLWGLFSEGIELLLLIGCVFILVIRYSPASSATRMFMVAGVGALLAYLFQGTGWYYQQLPALTLFGAALGLHLLDMAARRALHSPAWMPVVIGSLCVLAVVLTTHFMGYPFTTDRAFDLTSPDPAFFRSLPPGTPVAILTTSVDEAMMPVERFGLTWAQRTNNLWLLPAILRSETPPPGTAPGKRLTPLTLARLRSTQQTWMVEDLNRWRPQLVLVERCQDPAIACQVLEDRHDNLLAWFESDPAFQTLWQRYRYTGTRGRFDAYRLTPRR